MGSHALQLHILHIPGARVCCRAWVRGKGGVIVGDLPPYEAFPIGGTNSVRGYSEGAALV
jgi:outer membrane translocation and assembly module TamA